VTINNFESSLILNRTVEKQWFIHAAFLPRDAMLTRYMPYPCVCLSDTNSVLLNQLNVRSRKQRHTITKEL